jgi:flagellar assembly protein FliH
LVARGAFSESEVQCYSHVDLRQLHAPLPSEKEKTAEKREPGETPEGIDTSAETGPRSEESAALAVKELLAVAQQQVETIIADAQREAELLRHRAYEEGLAEGREMGKEQARQEFLPTLVAFAQLGQSLIVLEEQLIERFTPQLVRFALEIAEKVVGKAVEQDPDIIASVLERARAELPQARSIRIWLHPLDYQELTECRPDLVWVGEKGGRTVEVFSTEEVERGGCRVETEMGLVDATIPVQMQEMQRQMLD